MLHQGRVMSKKCESRSRWEGEELRSNGIKLDDIMRAHQEWKERACKMYFLLGQESQHVSQGNEK